MHPTGAAWAVQPSGLLKAGTIILLVGGILQASVGLLFLVIGTFMLVIGEAVVGQDEAAFPLVLMAILYLAIALLTAAGSVFTLQGYSRAKAGDAHSAWVRGLVGSLLPPVNLVVLVGAILCMVSPEGEAQGRQPAQAP